MDLSSGATVRCQPYVLPATAGQAAQPIKHNSGLSYITSRPRFLRVLSIAFEHVSSFPFKVLHIPFSASPDLFAFRLRNLAGRHVGSTPLGGSFHAGDCWKFARRSGAYSCMIRR